MSAVNEYLARARLALRYRGVGGILRHAATAPARALRRERDAPEGSEEIWALEWYHDQGGAVPATVIVTGGGGRAATTSSSPSGAATGSRTST